MGKVRGGEWGGSGSRSTYKVPAEEDYKTDGPEVQNET